MSKVVERLVAVVPPEGLEIRKMVKWLKDLEQVHGKNLVMRNMFNGRLAVFTPGEACWCMACESELAQAYENLTGELYSHLFIVCPDCGNKRCPRATHHANACTNSNDPGQEGSSYA